MDVVIPLSNGSYWEDNELRYCLRSLEKNLSDLDNVYILGHCPEWTKNVVSIPIGDPYSMENKGANIINKLTLICISNGISDNFLFVSDDQVLLKPISSKDIKTYYVYDLSDFNFTGGNKFWMECLKNTRDTLMKEGKTCYSFEPHTPVIINKNKFKEVMSRYGWIETLYPTLSLYYNNIIKKPQQLPDNYRVFYNQLYADLSLMEGKTWLGYCDLGLSQGLQKKLGELFPKKSKYEV